MEKILICPGERSAVGFLSQTVPLVVTPILGQPLLAYWMEWLANSGAKEVLVLATDRPESVRSVLQDGSRWGLRVQVRSELKEATPEQAQGTRAREGGSAAGSAEDILVVDHLPGMSEFPLFRSYRDWFTGVLAWMPRPAEWHRIGLREVQPQIWCGRRTQIASNAKIHPPCWLGDHVRVGPEAVIGPNAILENGVVIDSASEVRLSVIGPDTFVGSLTRVEGSIAWGSALIDWRTGSCTQVPDPFLLCALGQQHRDWSEGTGGSVRRSVKTFFTRAWGPEHDGKARLE